MKTLIFRLLLILSAANVIAHAAGHYQIKASLDSLQLTMGKKTVVRVDIVQPKDVSTDILVDKTLFPTEIELQDWIEGDTTDIGNGLVEINRGAVIQSFDSGAYVIPAFLLVSGPDTLRSNPLNLKVIPVDVSNLTDINPIADVSDYESKWYDWLPDWITDYWVWILFTLLIIAGGICGYLILSKKVNVTILPQKKRLPPDQIAFQRLTALKEAQLWEKGMEKEYYTRLIDILRDYLQERFGINAMEMTSSQILKALRDNEETKLSSERMQRVVEIADFVKFAKVRPLPDDNVRSFAEAVRFVEETRPLPEPETEATDASKESHS